MAKPENPTSMPLEQNVKDGEEVSFPHQRERMRRLIEYAKAQPDETRRLIFQVLSFLIWLGCPFAYQNVNPKRVAIKKSLLVDFKADLEVIR